jgi:hypothetical protein
VEVEAWQGMCGFILVHMDFLDRFWCFNGVHGDFEDVL